MLGKDSAVKGTAGLPILRSQLPLPWASTRGDRELLSEELVNSDAVLQQRARCRSAA